MKTYETTTTAGTLAGLFQFTAAKDPRQYLQGVHVCTAPNGGPMFAATDGHLFGAMPGNADDAGPVDAFTIPNELLKQIKTTPRNGGDVVRIRAEWADDDGGALITLEHNGATYTGHALDKRWPDFWRVVPATVSGEPVQIAPPLLSRFNKATGFFQGRPSNGYELHVFHNGEHAAARVVITSVPDFVGVVMPYHSKNVAPALALPEWATDKSQAQKAA